MKDYNDQMAPRITYRNFWILLLTIILFLQGIGRAHFQGAE